MDRYQRVERRRPEEPIGDNEMRITAQGLIRNYITYATTLLQEKQAKEIVLKAMGQAISKTVAITEILKKRIPGLYQDTSISSTSIVDVWEPIEEGLVPVELTRQVSLFTVTLSTTELNQNSPGYAIKCFQENQLLSLLYQAPSHVEQQNPGNQHQQPHQQQQQRQQRLQQPRQAYLPSAETSASSSYSLQKMVDTMIGVEEVGEAEVGVIVVLAMKEEEAEVMKEAEAEAMKEAEAEVMKEVRAMKQVQAEAMKEVEAEIMEQVLAMKEVEAEAEAEAMKGVGAEAMKVEAAEAMKVEEAEAMKEVEAEVMDGTGGGWEVGEGVVDTGKSIRWSVIY
ncbi:hypothetical protein RJ639_013666 [Escallonia herrerae]|uniref:DNA/RNA-binding protein Alba-like domain-containing protein n=1 Tax=Escallonia herrerae TaxID=1293975 RepID=A0AA89AP14_9ASTE|nr:hypothetical protein RJ639_013666 [Escallonia herrerae]